MPTASDILAMMASEDTEKLAAGKLALAELERTCPGDPIVIALSCHLALCEDRSDDAMRWLAKITEVSQLDTFFHGLTVLGGLRRVAGFLHRAGAERAGGMMAALLGLCHQSIYLRDWTATEAWPLDNSLLSQPVGGRMPRASHDLARRISETGQGMGDATPIAGGEVPWQDGTVLFNLVAQLRPRRILEIGFAKGLSTLFMLSAWDGVESHTVVDPLQWSAYRFNGVKNVTAVGHGDKLRLIQSPSSLAMPRLLADGESFDLIFIDGSHCFEHTIMEALYADLLAEWHTLVAFHDYHMEPVFAAIEFMRLNRGWAGLVAADVAILRRNRAKPNLQDNYVPFSTARPKS